MKIEEISRLPEESKKQKMVPHYSVLYRIFAEYEWSASDLMIDKQKAIATFRPSNTISEAMLLTIELPLPEKIDG